MNEFKNYEQEDTEIDLADLLKVLLKRWKSIILCAVIFALLGGAVSMLKGNGSKNASDEAELLKDLKKEYELCEMQYNDDLRLYENKEKSFGEYSEAVNMLTKELDKLDEIPDSDEERKTAAIIKISGLQTAVENAKTMTDYYKNLERPEKLKSFEEFAAEKSAEEENGFSKKFAAAGFVLGGFLACFAWAMVYLFDGTVKTVSELSGYCGVNMLGAPEQSGLVAANVRNFITDDIGKILITGSTDDIDLESILKTVSAAVSGIEIKAAGGLNSNADTAILLSGVDAVVLIEKIKKSKKENIINELMMIKSSGKKLIGIAI